MHMLDILDRGQWLDMETRIRRETGLAACVYDHEGTGVTGERVFTNRLCPEVRTHAQVLSGVCAVAHQNMAACAAAAGEPHVDECDAGLVKICVPVMHRGELVGVVGGCGLLLEDGEVEGFGLSMLTGLEEDSLLELARTIPVVTRAGADDMAARIAAIVAEGVAPVLSEK